MRGTDLAHPGAEVNQNDDPLLCTTEAGMVDLSGGQFLTVFTVSVSVKKCVFGALHARSSCQFKYKRALQRFCSG